MNEEVRGQLAKHLDLLCCPGCGADLAFELDADAFKCTGCATRFEFSNDIPQLFLPNDWVDSREDITDSMKAIH